MTLRALALALFAALVSAAPVHADEGQARKSQTALPGDVSAKRSVEAGGRTLAYTVSVEQVPLSDPEGKRLAEIVVTSYTLDGADPAARPITYAFNGGPGASSAWLNFGAIGPRRLAFGGEGTAPSDPPRLVDNAETWLAFTDLVFVDPVGTGYSRATGDAKSFYGVENDVDALSRVIAKHLALRNRLQSPLYLVGESYGGFRAPRIAERLRSRDGAAVRGLSLLSPVLDFAIRQGEEISPIPWANALPSMAATVRERNGPVTRADLADAEAYAMGDYLSDFLKGAKDQAAVERMSSKVAALTGLDPAFVRRLGGRVDIRSFVRELDRASGKVASLYDANVLAFDPDPFAARSDFDDPVLDAARAPLARAAVDFYARDLGYRVDRRYEVLADDVAHGWDWGKGQSAPDSVGALRSVLALDPKVRVIVAHGATDLVTPYMESKMALDQLPAFGDPDRVRLNVYPGGHMFYARDGSRADFSRDVRSMYEATAR